LEKALSKSRKTAIGDDENPAICFIVAKEMIVGIDGKIGSEGEEVCKTCEEEVKDRVRYLLGSGAEIFKGKLRDWVWI
jgi:hypothetical protein